MPNWRVHLEIAKKINEKIQFNNEDYNLFLLGNIAPDINNGFIVEGISHIYDHAHTHLYNSENPSTYTNFYQKYEEILKINPIAFGYLIHLYTDYLLNKDYKEKCEQNHLDKDEYIKFKHKDLRKYDSKYINNTINLNNYSEAIKGLQQIEEVELNKRDLEKVIKFLDNKQTTADTNLEFYTVEELDKEVENITSEIYKFIKISSIAIDEKKM